MAAIEATEEAILNSLFAATTIEGRDGHIGRAIPVDKVMELKTGASPVGYEYQWGDDGPQDQYRKDRQDRCQIVDHFVRTCRCYVLFDEEAREEQIEELMIPVHKKKKEVNSLKEELGELKNQIKQLGVEFPTFRVEDFFLKGKTYYRGVWYVNSKKKQLYMGSEKKVQDRMEKGNQSEHYKGCIRYSTLQNGINRTTGGR